MPYRDRLPTIPESPAPPHPSARVVSDESLLAARGAAGADDPLAVLRHELGESHRLTGKLLAQVGDLSEQLAHVQRVQNSLPPKPPVEVNEKAPTPAAWKRALFKLVVGAGAFLTAGAVWLGVRNATDLPPKVDAQQVRTTISEGKADNAATDVAALRGRLAVLEQSNREWVAYWIEIERLQGVQVKRPDGAASAPKIEAVVPLHRPGEVSSGPSLVINTPPP